MDILERDKTIAVSADPARSRSGAVDDDPRRHAAGPGQPQPHERRRHHRWRVEIFGRLAIGTVSHHVKTIDLSLGGALLATVEGAVAGTYGQLELPSLGSLRCRVVAITALGCHLAFEHENSPPVATRSAIDDIGRHPTGVSTARPARRCRVRECARDLADQVVPLAEAEAATTAEARPCARRPDVPRTVTLM